MRATPRDGSCQSFRADRYEELAARDAQRKLHPAIETRDERVDERSIDRIQLERVRAMDALAFEGSREPVYVFIGVNGDAWRALRRAMESRRVGAADIDPRSRSAGEIAN